VLASPTEEHTGRLSDEVELYQRTYNTLLRSSGETHLRVLEPAHRAMGSSLHPLADSDEPDLGAFLYAIRRMPDSVSDGVQVVILGQEKEIFARNGIDIADWQEADAAARRRRWYESGDGRHAVLIASASDVDDLVPTLVAFQIEWNKLRVRQRAAGWPPDHDPTDDECAEVLGGTPEDWGRLREAWLEQFMTRLQRIADQRMNMRVRMLGGTQVGYARMTRRWWQPVHGALADQQLVDRPLYFVSSNTHSLVNIATGVARELHREPDALLAVQPTRGLDVGAIEFVHRQLVAERDKGRGVLLLSFDLDEIMDLSDRILVIYGGQIVGEFLSGAVTRTELGLLMGGKPLDEHAPAAD